SAPLGLTAGVEQLDGVAGLPVDDEVGQDLTDHGQVLEGVSAGRQCGPGQSACVHLARRQPRWSTGRTRLRTASACWRVTGPRVTSRRVKIGPTSRSMATSRSRPSRSYPRWAARVKTPRRTARRVAP